MEVDELFLSEAIKKRWKLIGNILRWKHGIKEEKEIPQ